MYYNFLFYYNSFLFKIVCYYYILYKLSSYTSGLYVESMGRTLLNLFKSYYSQLAKLESVIATKNDLIAVEEATLKSLFSQKVDMSKRSDSFALAGREKVLEQVRKASLRLCYIILKLIFLLYIACYYQSSLLYVYH